MKTQAVITAKSAGASAPAVSRSLGQNIVVIERGFIYVGEVEFDGQFINITNARCIRRWGTKKGLAELKNGPLKETILEDPCDVVVPFHSLVHLLPCKGF